jgi:hypothetical protein
MDLKLASIEFGTYRAHEEHAEAQAHTREIFADSSISLRAG